MTRHPAFSDAVRAAQSARGSRDDYAAMEARGPRTDLAPLAPFLAEARSLVLATASADGQPYVQHRGGPPGFVRVLGPARLGFADVGGNAQYVTLGNLSENPRAQILVIDFMRRRRIKLWGRAMMVEDDAVLLARLAPSGRPPAPRAFVLDVAQWDANCPAHIPQRFEADDVAAKLAERDARIAALEHELQVLRARGFVREGCAGAGDFD